MYILRVELSGTNERDAPDIDRVPDHLLPVHTVTSRCVPSQRTRLDALAGGAFAPTGTASASHSHSHSQSQSQTHSQTQQYSEDYAEQRETPVEDPDSIARIADNVPPSGPLEMPQYGQLDVQPIHAHWVPNRTASCQPNVEEYILCVVCSIYS